MNKKYKTGLIIGRFQPFHRGHLYLVEKALRQCEKLMVGFGSSNIQNSENPYSPEERKIMILGALSKKSIPAANISLATLPDFPDDDEWFKETIKRTGPVEVLFGNNEWTNKIFEKNGILVVRIPYHRRDKFEGKKIREQLRKQGKLPALPAGRHGIL